MAVYALISAEDVLTFSAGPDAVLDPSPDPGTASAWAVDVARGINAGIAARLGWGDDWDAMLDVDAVYELRNAALIASGDDYKRRESPFGVAGYADSEGVGFRVAKDYLESVRPIVDRYRNVAAGFA